MSDKTAAEMSLPELLRTHMPVSDGAIMSYMAGDVCERAADQIERLSAERDRLHAALESIKANCSPDAISLSLELRIEAFYEIASKALN